MPDEFTKTLDDGRVLILYPRIYNWLLTISTAESLALGIYDDGW